MGPWGGLILLSINQEAAWQSSWQRVLFSLSGSSTTFVASSIEAALTIFVVRLPLEASTVSSATFLHSVLPAVLFNLTDHSIFMSFGSLPSKIFLQSNQHRTNDIMRSMERIHTCWNHQTEVLSTLLSCVQKSCNFFSSWVSVLRPDAIYQHRWSPFCPERIENNLGYVMLVNWHPELTSSKMVPGEQSSFFLDWSKGDDYCFPFLLHYLPSSPRPH